MNRIAHLAFSVTAAIVALVVVDLLAARAEEPGLNPDGMIGVWRCSGARPGLQPETISIQSDGYVMIDAAGHMIVGPAQVEFSRPWQGALVVAVENSDLDESIGMTVRLRLKVNSDYSVMGIGFENDYPFELNRLCRWMEAQP